MCQSHKNLRTFDQSPAALFELDVGCDPESGLVVSHTRHAVSASCVECVAVRDVVVHNLNIQKHEKQQVGLQLLINFCCARDAYSTVQTDRQTYTHTHTHTDGGALLCNLTSNKITLLAQYETWLVQPLQRVSSIQRFHHLLAVHLLPQQQQPF